METDTILEAARAHDHDRYLSALLAPRAVRDDLLALAAFAGEIARIPQVVSDPTIGEIRLQWWRDALPAMSAGAATGSPLADAVGIAIRRHQLPGGLILGLLEARAFDLYADPMPDEQTFKAYLAKTDGALVELGLRIAGGWPPGVAVRAILAAGQAIGLTRVLTGLPHALARGRCALPQTRLARAGLTVADLAAVPLPPAAAALVAELCDEARAALAMVAVDFGRLSRRQRVALLPVALVGPQLRALQRGDHHPGRDLTALLPLTRVWRLWCAHALGRL